jgi:peptidyl-prolyl cis-trans isomerase SurA
MNKQEVKPMPIFNYTRNRCTLKCFNRYLTITILLAVFLFFTPVSEIQCKEIVDRIVAIVNDDIITLYDLKHNLKPYEERIKAMGYSFEQDSISFRKIKKDVLNQLIEQKIKNQEVKRTWMKVSPTEVDNAIAGFKKDNYLDDNALSNLLKAQGLTLEEYRKNTEEQILRMKLINYEVKSKIVITKDEIQTYYESNIDKYKGESKLHLRNIVMRTDLATNDEEKLLIKNKMELIMEKLKQGKTFADLARTYSESSLAMDGGNLGLFMLEELSPQLQEKIKHLKAKEFTDIIDTDQGYQIIYIEDIIETKGKSVEDADVEIQNTLYKTKVDQKFRTWIENLRKKSHIKILE